MAAAAAACASSALFFLHSCPRQAIISGNIASIAMLFLFGLSSLAAGSALIGGGMVLLAAVNAVIIYAFRSRIPFSALLLKVASGIGATYTGLIVVNFFFVAAFAMFTVFIGAMTYPSMYRFIVATIKLNEAQNNNNNLTLLEVDSKDAFIIIYGAFCFFWASQVAYNLAHITAAGVTATWYFVGGHGSMPTNPTLSSLRRALTTSFGSVCFGSLLVALVRLLRMLIHTQRNSDHPFIACVLECIVGCIEFLIQYFNTYAFVYCAIYGYDYKTAAIKTYRLAENSIFAAVFNDALVNGALTMTAFAFAGVAFLIFYIVFSSFALGTVAFIITIFVTTQVFRIIDSAVTTLFVCFAEEPNILAQVNPELYEKIISANRGNNIV